MNDFLDMESPEIASLLTEEIADLAARKLIFSLKESWEWKQVARAEISGTLYTAPEFR